MFKPWGLTWIMEFSFLPIPPREWTCVLKHWTRHLNPWIKSASLELQLPSPKPRTGVITLECWSQGWHPLPSTGACSGKLTNTMGARDTQVCGAHVILDTEADCQSVDASHGPLECLPFCYIPSDWTARSLGILLPCHGLEAVGGLQLFSDTSKQLKQGLHFLHILPKLSF